jgi:hypothetical protein
MLRSPDVNSPVFVFTTYPEIRSRIVVVWAAGGHTTIMVSVQRDKPKSAVEEGWRS